MPVTLRRSKGAPTRSPSSGAHSGVLATGLLFLALLSGPGALLAQTDLGSGQLRILGAGLDASPEAQTVPVGIPTIVQTILQAPAGSLPATVTVLAELTGPGIAGALALTTVPNGAFTIPGQAVRGGYLLSNIRLMDGNTFIAYATHRDVSITVTDILIAQVTSRPLTYQEMVDKGIVVSSKNFRAYSFVFALEIQSRLQQFEVPIVFPEFGPPILPSVPQPVGLVLPPEGFSPPQVRSVGWGCASLIPDAQAGASQVYSAGGTIELPCGVSVPSGQPDNGSGPDTRPILLSLLLIPGDVSFLNQFFSLSVLVQNGAPAGSNLRLDSLTAKVSLPPALRTADTNPPTNLSDPVSIVDPGPDGQIGTADDLTFLIAQSVGKAEFVVEGLQTGRWDVPIDLTARLTGLPGGPVSLQGKTTGSVLVRNPSFFVTLDHPDVIRTGESYTISATVVNTSAIPANQVSVQLDRAFLTGATLLSAETIALGNLNGGDSAVAKFSLTALRTGRVTSDAFFGTGSLSGSVVLHAGIGELSIPLSPDTLVFPRTVDQVPASLVDPARRLLGLAWSIAKSPDGLPPAGLSPVGEQAVRWRIDDLIFSARHKSLGEADSTAWTDWMLGWLNAGPHVSLGFDKLRRSSVKGGELAAAWGAQLTSFFQTETPFNFQKRIATALPDRSYLSATVSSGTTPASPSARLTLKNRLSSGRAQRLPAESGYDRSLLNAEIYQAQASGTLYELGWVGAPDPGGYTIQITGTRSDSVTLTVTYPGAAGKTVVASFGPFAVTNGSSATVDVIPGVDPGSLVLAGPGATATIQLSPRPALTLVNATQDLAADPRGHAVALLFNRSPLQADASQDLARFLVRPSSGVNPDVTAFLQSDPRLLIVGVANQPSPYTTSTVQVSGLTDAFGAAQSPDPQIVNLDVRDHTAGGSVSGVVIGATGQPVPGATVVLRLPQVSDTTGQTFLDDFASATADAAGHFAFDYVQIRQGSVFQIFAGDPVTGYNGDAYGQIQTQGQALTVNVVLLGRGDVTGRVVDGSGAPIPNAYITADSVFYKGNGNHASTNSASDGTFRFHALPVGAVQLWAIDPISRRTAFQVASIPNAGGTANTTIVITGTPRASISGDVVHERDGSPAVGLYVVAYGDVVAVPYGSGTDRKYFGFRVTDGNGRFSFADVAPGADLVQVYDFSRSSSPIVEYTLTVAANTNTVLHLVALEPQTKVGSVDGFVRVSTNGTVTPLANALVSVTDSPVRALTDSTGHYHLDGVPIGVRAVTALSPPPQNRQQQTATVQEGLTFSLDFLFVAATVTNRTIRGVVRDPLGRAVGAAGVAEFDASGNVVRSVLADGSGNYVLSAVPPGVHKISALGRDDASGTLRDDVGDATVNLDGLSDAVLDIGLRGIGTIRGTVVGSHLNDVGLPIDSPLDARLTLSAGRLVKVGQYGFVAAPGSALYLGDAAADTLPSDGSYSFANVVGGSYALTCHHAIFGDLAASGTLGSAQTVTQTFRYDNALAWIDGYLYDQSGAPIAGADVDLWQGSAPADRTTPQNPPYATVKTISDPADPRGLGYFRFISLPNRSFTLSFGEVVNGLLRFDQAIVSVGNVPHAIRVTLRPRVVQDVRVTINQLDANSNLTPVSLAAVALHETEWPNRTFQGSTAVDGTVLFPGVSQGRFTVNAQRLTAAGSGGGCVCVEGGTVSASINLPGSGSVRGNVRFPGTGAPVANAQVLLLQGGTPVGAAQTDTNGLYQIDGAELGRTFAVQVKDSASARSGFGTNVVLSVAGEIQVRDVTLLALGSVSGRFTDAAGVRGIAGATVTLTSNSLLGLTRFYSGTDGSGNFTFAGIPQGAYSLSSQDPVTRLSGHNDGAIDLEGVTVTTNVQAQAAGTVAVSVTDSAGSALSIPPVVTLSVAGMPARTVIASSYSFGDVPVGAAFTITAEEQASPPHHRASSSGALVTNGETQTFPIRYAPYGSVNVHVVRAGTGADVTRGSVAIYNNGLYPGQFPFDQWLTVDGTGRAAFVNVGGGPLTAKYWDPVTRRYTTATGQISTEGSAAAITVTVDGLVDVSGRVLKPAPNSSQPAAGTSVTLGGRTVVTSVDGNFLLDGSAAGTYTLDLRNDAVGGRLSIPITLASATPSFNVGDLILDGMAPAVVQLTPPDGTTNVARNQPIQILFSEPVRLGNGNSLQAFGPDHTLYGNVSFSADRRTLYWSAGLHPATTYRFHLGTDAVTDDAGWPLAVVWNSTFTTVDDRGPAIVQTVPAPNSIQVPVATTVVVVFDSAIDPASVRPGTIVLEQTRPTAGVISGTVAVGGNSSTVVFTPSVGLPDQSGFKATVAGLKGMNGIAMYAPYVFTFGTTDNVSPAIAFDPPPAQFYTGGNYQIGLNWTSNDIQAIGIQINGAGAYPYVIYPAPGDRTAKFTDWVRTPDSPRVIAVTPVDFAGNTGATTRISVPVVVDAPPAVSIQITSATSLAIGGTLTGTVTATDDRGLSNPLFLSLGSTVIPCPMQGSVSWSDVAGQTSATRTFSFPVPLTAAKGGVVTINVYAYDTSDARQSTIVINNSVTVQKDTTLPVIANVSPAGGSSVPAGSVVTVSADVTDNTLVGLFDNDGAGHATAGSVGNRWSTRFTAPTATGAFTVHLIATDWAGNVATSTLSLTAGSDNPPAGTITFNPTGAILPNGGVSVQVNATDDHGLSRVAVRAVNAAPVDYSNGLSVPLAGTSASASFIYRLSNTVPGGSTADFYADIDDAQGHRTTVGPVSVTVAQDTAPPVPKNPKPPIGTAIVSGQTTTLSVQADDNVEVVGVDATVDGTTGPMQLISEWICPAGCFWNYHWDASYRGKVVASPTVVPIRFSARDRAGNVATLDHSILVNPNTSSAAPAVTVACPSDGALLPAGYTTTLTATTADDTNVLKVEFYLDPSPTPFYTATSAPWQTTYTVPAGAAAGSTFTLRARSYDFASHTADGTSLVKVVTGTFLYSDTVILSGSTTYDNQTLIVAGGTTTIAGSHPFANVVVLSGARVTTDLSTAFTTSLLDLTRVSGKVYIGCGGSVDVNGKGFLGGGSTGNGSSYGRSIGNVDGAAPDVAGSHGGLGLNAPFTAGSTGKPGGTYGNYSDPQQPGGGSGFHQFAGSSGGGVLKVAAPAVIVDGTASANGDANAWNGGAGGSIRIDATTISGGGLVQANGGTPIDIDGAIDGGGGRVAVYGDWSRFSPLRFRARGGSHVDSTRIPKSGGAGTVFLKSPTAVWGELWADDGARGSGTATPLLAIGSGTVGTVAGATITDATKDLVPEVAGLYVTVTRSSTTIGTYRVVSASHTSLTLDTNVAGIVLPGDAYSGLARFDRLTVRDGARLTTSDAIEATNLNGVRGATQTGSVEVSAVRGTSITLDGAQLATYGGLTYPSTTVGNGSVLSTFGPSSIGATTVSGVSTFSGNAPVTATTFAVSGGSLLTHAPATATAVYRLDVTASGAMTIDSTSRVDVTGLGYVYGRSVGNQPAAMTQIPGMYGGVGGIGGSLAGTPAYNALVYGAFVDPRDPGTPGNLGLGGGSVHLGASTLTLDAPIVADGTGFNNRQGYPGAGGSVRIDATTLLGAGSISATGGIGSNYVEPSGFVTGGAGGGRVAVYGDMSGFDRTRIKARGGYGPYNGAPGTVYFKGPSQTYGDLIVENGGASSATTPLPGIGTGTLTGVSGATVTASTTFPNSVVGLYLQVSHSGSVVGTWKVIAQSGGTLTLETTVQGTVAVGDTYKGVLRLDTLTVGSGSQITTPDLNDSHWIGISPLTVNSPGTVAGTVFLGAAAPAGGLTFNLTSSNTSVATVPATATVNAGATSAGFTVTALTVASPSSVTISAARSGLTKSETMTVLPPAGLASVSLNFSTVVGGSGLILTGTVTLGGGAPTGGAVVTLTSSATAAATVPASVTVPQGATSATFPVTHKGVASSTSVTISATFSGSTRTAPLTVTAAVLQSLGFAPSVVGGNPVNALVLLNGGAPPAGAVVTLTSSNPAVASVPGSVTIPFNATSQTAVVTTVGVASSTNVMLTAVYAGTTLTPILTVDPARLWSLALSPTSVPAGTPSTGTVRLDGAAASGGAVVTLSSSDTTAVTVPASVTLPQGSSSITFQATTLGVSATKSATITASRSGLQTTAVLQVLPASLVSVSAPINVVGGSTVSGTVTLSAIPPTGGAVVTLSSNNANATVPASVTVPVGSTTATFNVTTTAVSTPATATITASYLGVNRTAAINLKVAAPSVASFTASPTTVLAGQMSFCTVTLSGPAPTGDGYVSLTSSDQTTVPVFSPVIVLAGQTSVSFWLTAKGVASNTNVTITATTTGTPKTVTLTVTPADITGLSLAPPALVGGSPSTATVTLNGNAPATGGAVVTLTSSDTSAATVPASMTVAANLTSGTFPVTTLAVASQKTVTINATYRGVTKPATLTVNPPPPPVSSLVLSPTTVVSGASSTGTVTMPSAAPTGGTIVTLSSSDTTAATVPATVTVAVGATTATFLVTTLGVASAKTPTISAQTTGAAKTAVLTVNPASLSSLSVNPTIVVGGAATSILTVTLDGKAPPAGAVVTLSSALTSAATIAATGTVPSGSTSATFNVSTLAQTSSKSVTLTGVYNSVTKTATLTVNPPAPAVSTVTFSPPSVVGAQPSTGTVTLASAAYPGGAVVTLSSNNAPVAAVPANVIVLAGQTSATFQATTHNVGTSTTVTITSQTTGTAKTGTLIVTPCTLSGVAAPSFQTGDVVWFDDSIPAGVTPYGTWTWDTAQKASGTQSHTDGIAAGLHYHGFNNANSANLYVGATDKLVTYVLIDPCNPPQEVLLQVDTGFNGPRRAFWGTELTGWGTLGTDLISMGPLPTAGQWVRLEVPASTLVIGQKTVGDITFATYDGRAWFDRTGIGKTCTTSVAPPPVSIPSTDVVWVEDATPVGVTLSGTWNWDTTQKATGTKSHEEPAGRDVHSHGFSNSWSNNLYVAQSDRLVTYVLVDPCDPPEEVMLQFDGGGFLTRAFWGADKILWGTLGTDRFAMGPLPPAGGWVRLEVPASLLGLGGRTVGEIDYVLFGGHAWFDHTGKGATCFVGTAPVPPSFPAGDTIWLDDSLPAGATTNANWTWDPIQFASGTRSHTQPTGTWIDDHTVDGASTGLAVAASDKLFVYALVNPCDPPAEIMLQFHADDGWEHRAFWGPDLIGYGTAGTPSRAAMGPMPATGSWVRLEIPASTVGLGGLNVYGVSFVRMNGQVWWDRFGKATSSTPAIASVTLSPTSVVSGNTSTGTVTLAAAAPTGGAFVALSTSDASLATVPSNATIAAGTLSQSFTVTTIGRSAAASVTVSATYVNTATASLALTAAPLGLATVSANPPFVVGGVASTGVATLTGPAPAGGTVVTLTSSNTAVATVPASVTVLQGTTFAMFPITTTAVASVTPVTITGVSSGVTKTGVLTVNPPGAALSSGTVSPTSVIGGTSSAGTVTLTGPAPLGGAVVTLTSGTPAAAAVPASVTVAAGQTTAPFTATTSAVASSTPVTISAVYSGVTKTATLTVNPPALTSVAMAPTAVVGGAANSAGTVTLTGPAPTGGIVVTLSSNVPAAASVPASVTVPAGQTTAPFTATTSAVASATPVTISAVFSGVTKTATLTVNPPALTSVTMSPATLVGGVANSTGTVTLTGPAPTGGIVVTLSSNVPAAASVPASVTVTAGQTTAPFTATTSAVGSSTPVTISAVYSGVTKTATLTVNPNTALSSVSVSPTSVVGGNPSTGTVTLASAAPAGGVVVTLSCAPTAACSVPASVTVAAAATTQTFQVTTSGVASSTTATVTAIGGGVTKTATLTVTPAALSSVALAPSSVSPGGTSTATVTLTGMAPTGGIVVTLSSSNTSVATVPISVTVPAGASTANKTVTAVAVGSSTISAVYSSVTKTAVLTVSSCPIGTMPPPGSFPAGDVVWDDDDVPPGATGYDYGVFTWDPAQKASGTRSHTDPLGSGLHYHGWNGAWNANLYVKATDKLVTYVLIDPCNPPPQQVLLQWDGGIGGDRRAYWGTDQLHWGTDGVDQFAMGPVPSAGQWTRLEVPASLLGLGEKTIGEMTFVLWDGKAWFDRSGTGSTCTVSTVAPPGSFPASDIVFIDDTLPVDAVTSGYPADWAWDSTQKASGSSSHVVAAARDEHYQVADNLWSSNFYVSATGTIYTYVLLDPCDPPQEVMLQIDAGGAAGQVYWGANNLPWGTDGVDRLRIGSLPTPGVWSRLEFPASLLGMGQKTIGRIAFALWGGRAWFDRLGTGAAGCTVSAAPPPSLFAPYDTVWVDDSLPAGVDVYSYPNPNLLFTWDTSQKASGTKSHVEPAARDTHYHGFRNAWQYDYYVSQTDTIVTYVLVDPCDPPAEILLQWDITSHGGTRAYWGPVQELTGWGPSVRMGPVPPTGVWTRLEVPASALGVQNEILGEFDYVLVGGRAWFDRTGKGTTCTLGTPPAPASFPSGDTVWIDDNPPVGATPNSNWIWDTAQKASGTRSHTQSTGSWIDEHGFDNASTGLAVASSDKLFVYALVNPCDPPLEIMIQFLSDDGWEHRAYWGQDIAGNGTSGTPSRAPMGPMPASGSWMRLEIPASTVALGGKTIYGVDFLRVKGQVWWDRFGKGTSSTPAISSVTLNPTSVLSGNPSTGTVTLAAAAPAGGAVVALSTSDPSLATVPPTVTVAAGTTSKTFTVTTLGTRADTSVVVTATYVNTATATLALTAAPLGLSSIILAPTSVQGPTTFAGTATLTQPAPVGGAVVALTSSNTAVATVPATVTVLEGFFSASFPITTLTVASSTPVTITGAYASVTKQSILTVDPGGPALVSVALSPAIITGGVSVLGTVTLSGPAPAGGTVVTLTSGNTSAATVPATVTVAAGAAVGNFTVTTNVVATSATFNISAAFNSVTKTAALTVNP